MTKSPLNTGLSGLFNSSETHLINRLICNYPVDRWLLQSSAFVIVALNYSYLNTVTLGAFILKEFVCTHLYWSLIFEQIVQSVFSNAITDCYSMIWCLFGCWACIPCVQRCFFLVCSCECSFIRTSGKTLENYFYLFTKHLHTKRETKMILITNLISRSDCLIDRFVYK